MVGFSALLALPAVGDAVIEATPQPDGGFRLTLEVDEAIGVGTGQEMLLPKAVRLCDGLLPRFGTYEFKATQAVAGQRSGDSFVLVQDIECGGAARTEDQASGRELGDAERMEIERVARGRAVAYHNALAEGRDSDVFAMFPGLSASATPHEAWRREQAEFRAKAGGLRGIDVWKVTIYVDPPGGPEPGIYVATDLEVSYENLTVCGYFMWFEEPDGTLRITRREVGELRRDLAVTITESQLAKLRNDFRCRPETEPD